MLLAVLGRSGWEFDLLLTAMRVTGILRRCIEQSLQITLPHRLQWCLRRIRLNVWSHTVHLLADASGCQTCWPRIVDCIGVGDGDDIERSEFIVGIIEQIWLTILLHAIDQTYNDDYNMKTRWLRQISCALNDIFCDFNARQPMVVTRWLAIWIMLIRLQYNTYCQQII